MAEAIQTTWMWHDEASNGVKGAIIDFDDRVIQWMDQPGCACGDNSQPQSFDDFIRQGAIESVPDDVEAEIEAVVTQVSSQTKES